MRSKSPRSKKTATAGERPPVFYRLHALLHTIHAIEQYEDQLCSLLHEIQTSGGVSEVVSEELRDLLEQIPSSGYQDEVNAVRQALNPVAAAPLTPRRAPAKKTAARRRVAANAK